MSRFGLAAPVRRYREVGKRHSLEGPWLDSASALPSSSKGCGLWTLSCDFVPHVIKMDLIAAHCNAGVILVVTQTPSTGLRHPSFPESDARSVVMTV